MNENTKIIAMHFATEILMLLSKNLGTKNLLQCCYKDKIKLQSHVFQKIHCIYKK